MFENKEIRLAAMCPVAKFLYFIGKKYVICGFAELVANVVKLQVEFRFYLEKTFLEMLELDVFVKV